MTTTPEQGKKLKDFYSEGRDLRLMGDASKKREIESRERQILESTKKFIEEIADSVVEAIDQMFRTAGYNLEQQFEIKIIGVVFNSQRNSVMPGIDTKTLCFYTKLDPAVFSFKQAADYFDEYLQHQGITRKYDDSKSLDLQVSWTIKI